MRVISRKILREFWEIHHDCEEQLKAWYQEANVSSWQNPSDIKSKYPSASILQQNRVVFNIKGNNYRLIVKISYKHQILWIRFIGSNDAYNKIDATII
ncbi:MAG: type II toxin-antitoxin system HigB family toxin [Sphingobacteriaceae bacterium]|nr:MAG: type II toxin-antitoxin system HigB family toxin [Sphingobacteriaceae bacterium]